MFVLASFSQPVFYVATDVPAVVAQLSAAFPRGTVVGYGGGFCPTSDASSSSTSSSELTRSGDCLRRALVEQLMLCDDGVTARVTSAWST